MEPEDKKQDSPALPGAESVVADWRRRVAAIPETLLSPKDHDRTVNTLMGVMTARSWADIARQNGFTLSEYVYLRRVSSVFRKLSEEARKVADDLRQAIDVNCGSFAFCS